LDAAPGAFAVVYAKASDVFAVVYAKASDVFAVVYAAPVVFGFSVSMKYCIMIGFKHHDVVYRITLNP
jgi:hypothetical protein